MPKTFSGSTEDAQSPILSAEFWKKGVRIEAKVIGIYQSKNGPLYNLLSKKPVTVKGEKGDKISIGGLKGFQMALRAAGIPEEKLLIGDAVIIECTGSQSNEDRELAPMVLFKVAVSRQE